MRLYIDPATGSMLFTVLIAVFGSVWYLLRDRLAKLKFLITGGAHAKEAEADRIPFAIFSDSKRYWNLFEPICDEFERRGKPLTYLTASPDDPALEKEYQHIKCVFIGEGNRAFARLNFLKADILLSTTPGLEVYQWKRSRDVKWYVHVLHAAGDPCIYRMFGLDYYDAVLISGEYHRKQIRKLERLRHLPEKELVMTGLPYMDELLRRAETAPPLPPHPVTILLAPSWGKSAIFARYGGSIIDALLSTGYYIIIRPHPQSFVSEKEMIEGLMASYPDSNQLEWNRDNDNFEALRRADLLISDFSGVILDFCLVFRRPVLYADTSFDTAPYDAAWLEFDELWTFRVLPKIGRQLTADHLADLKPMIEEMLNNVQYDAVIEEARRETWEHIGRSASLAADYLIGKYDELREEAVESKYSEPGVPA